jgi:hypothetical protein
MLRYFSPIIAGSVLGGLLVATGSLPAQAEATDTALATALDLPAGITVKQAGDLRAFGVASTTFNDFPRRFGNGQYAVMSTGKASDLFNLNVAGNQPSTDLSGDGDSASMTFAVGPGVTDSCLVLDVAMGTEERAHTYAPSNPSDTISLKAAGDLAEYAQHWGPRYVGQEAERVADVSKVERNAMSVNAIDYWHGIEEEFERQPDDKDAPLLSAMTRMDNFTSVETFEVPIGKDSEVTLSIADAGNDSLDSLAMVDRVRTARSCSWDVSAGTGLYLQKPAVIEGHRGVQNILTVDLIPGTPQIERYDAAGNGWYPSGVDLRFRWYRYERLTADCNDGMLSHWIPIKDADRQSFSPTLDEKGHCVMALVTGRKDGFRSETFPSPADREFSPTLPIQNGVFSSEDAPSISSPKGLSVVRVGDELTATTGKFYPRPDSYEFQWLAEGLPILGETGRTFKVTAGQANKRIRVKVTAARLNFNDLPALSLETPGVEALDLTATPKPTVTGTGRVGDPLAANTGQWAPDPVGLTYQWYSNDVPVTSGGTRATYTPTPAQLGKQIKVSVIGSKAGYKTVAMESMPVTIAPQVFVAPIPVVNGTGNVGDALTAGNVVWTPAARMSYQWFGVEGAIAGANGPTFRPGEDRAGQRVYVEVTGVRDGYVTTKRASQPVLVRAKQFITKAPTMTGSFTVGGRLRAVAGTWLPEQPSRVSYEWFVGSSSVPIGTGTSLTVPASAAGRQIRLVMTGGRTSYASASSQTLSRTIAHGTIRSSAPRVSGSPRPGKKLLVSARWSPTPVAYRYQWYVGSKKISRATKSSYKVPKKYRGKKIRVRVVGTKAGHRTVTRYSAYKRIARK